MAATAVVGQVGHVENLKAAESSVLRSASPKERLGKLLFEDVDLSDPPGQSCATCHGLGAGFADPDRSAPTSKGVRAGLFGDRNTPSAAYMAFSPKFHFDETEEHYVGGQFWDGRAATLEEQAKGPFLNPLEMANTHAGQVVDKVRAAPYAPLFAEVFGASALGDAEQAYERIAEAIAAWQRTPVFSPFSSKYDAWLAGRARLTAQERRGLALFEREDKGNCAACHPIEKGPDGRGGLGTDFTYDNLGVPKNPANPFYRLAAAHNPAGEAHVDLGLGGVVDFYNTRDVKPRCKDSLVSEADALRLGCWPRPEMVANVNTDELGNLRLSPAEVDDIVAFMLALTDGWSPPSAR